MWAWWPFWSYDQNNLNKHSSSNPLQLFIKSGFKASSCFAAEDSRKNKYECPWTKVKQQYKKQRRKGGDTIFPIISQWGLSIAMDTKVLIQSAPKMHPFPHPNDATHKIWSRLADWLQRYSSSKVWHFPHSRTCIKSRTNLGQIGLLTLFFFFGVSNNFPIDL